MLKPETVLALNLVKNYTFQIDNATKQHFLKKCTTSALPLTKIIKRS